MIDIWERVAKKFTSGNSVPVSQAVITRKEYEEMLASYQTLSQINPHINLPSVEIDVEHTIVEKTIHI